MKKILVHDWGGYHFSLDLSRELARRGHHVEHMYFPPACASVTDMERRDNDPDTLAITPLTLDVPYAKYNFFRRRAHEIAYGRKLAEHIRATRPDVVISANTPLDVQKRALAASRQTGAQFLFWLQDIISLAMIEILRDKLGLPGALVGRHYRNVERATLSASDRIVCISEDFIPLLESWGIPARQCTVIENWAPKDDVRPMPKDNPWARAHGLHDKKVLLYSGRLGFKHNPDLLLQLAKGLRNDPDIVVAVVAEGVAADWLRERQQESHLENLRLFPFQPYKDLPQVLGSADILVNVIEPSASIYSVPSKILTYLAAGRPLLAAIPKDNLNARHIARIGAGKVVSPTDAGAFVTAARELLDAPQMRARAADAARAYAEQAFDTVEIANRFERLFQA